jgi:hypothetical protein
MIIWIASYPKSGNTWVRSLISLLLFSENGKMENFDILKMIEQYPIKKYFSKLVNNYDDPIQIQKNWIISQKKINKDKKIRFFKTHHLFCKYGENAFTDNENTLGVIHVVRDPRSLVKSLKNHFNLQNLEEAKEKLFDIQLMTGVKINQNKAYSFPVMISSWNNHYNSWKKIKKNYLLIKYENLINNPKKELLRIIDYLNKIKTININKEKFDNILRSTTFDNFKKLENNGLFSEANLDPITGNFKSFFNTDPNIKKKPLKKKIIKEIEKKFHKELKELGYL